MAIENTMRQTDIELKNRLEDSLKDFQDFCNSHGLVYYVAYGTLIGTVRHRGFIPWDDDVDVFMPRADYEKLLTLKGMLPSNYELIDYMSSPNYYLYFAKFCDRNSTIMERKGEMPLGIYIDIFVLDYYDEKIYTHFWNHQHLYRFLWLTYWHACRHYSVYAFRESFKMHDLKRIMIMLLDSSFLRVIKYPVRKIIERWMKKLASPAPCDKLCMYSMLPSSNRIYGSSEQRIYSIDWFGKGLLLPFGNIKVRVPKNYDACLRIEYGDWQKMPPPKQQVSHHFHYFLDFEKRYTIAEIEKIKKRGI